MTVKKPKSSFGRFDTSLAAWSLKNVVETAPNSMAMFDNSMRYLAVSKQYLIDNKIGGETQDSIVGHHVFEFRRDNENAREVNRRVLAGETLRKEDFCFRRPDGGVLWMRWQMQPWRLPNNCIGGALLSIEITQQRKEAEERLAASESLLRLSQEAGHIGSYDWDIGGGQNRWSDEQCRLHGIEPSGGKSIPIEQWRTIVHPDDLPAVERKISEIIRTGGSAEIEHRIVTQQGVRWLYGRGQLVREAGGPTRLIGINMDITERKLLEDNLRELTRTLEYRVAQEIEERGAVQTRLAHAEKLQSIGELTGGVAHDFNNMLTVITGTIDILLQGVADRPELASIARMIGSAAERGAALTANLLAFARKQALRSQSVDIATIISTATDLLTSSIGRHIDIKIVRRSYIGQALVDPDQLVAAIVNLGINARDAMPGGGQLTIDADLVQIDGEEASSRELSAGNYVCITLTDTGTGIEKSIENKIFEPFFSTKGVGRGTGLGLSMVYGFAKQSGGHVEFSTKLNSGTTFSLYLPTCEQKQSLVEMQEAQLPLGVETILCVEDDESVRNSVVMQLQSLGYKTIVATNALQALETIRTTTKIDLVFTDIVMPGSTDGWKLAGMIREIRPAVKILYTTGYSDLSSDQMRSETGVLLLQKPYRLSKLAHTIRQALKERNYDVVGPGTMKVS